MSTANISFYANETDAQVVLDWLIAQNEIGFIVADGEKRWRALHSVKLSQIVGAKHWLWHIPSGPLPLLQDYRQPILQVENPWIGWREIRTGADKSLPYFGSAPTGTFLLSLSPVSRYFNEQIGQPKELAPPGLRVLGRSDFTYPGKTEKPPNQTLAFWKRLEKFMFSAGVPVDPHGSMRPEKDPTPASVANNYDWIALPGALAEMRAGVPWRPNPD